MFGPVKFETNQRCSKISKNKLSERILSFTNTQYAKWQNPYMV